MLGHDSWLSRSRSFLCSLFWRGFHMKRITCMICKRSTAPSLGCTASDKYKPHALKQASFKQVVLDEVTAPPDVGLAPTALWRDSPRQLKGPSLKPQPFPPHQSSLLPPPPGSFCDSPKEPTWAGVGEAAHGGGGGGALQAALGVRPTSRGTRRKGLNFRFSVKRLIR